MKQIFMAVLFSLSLAACSHAPPKMTEQDETVALAREIQQGIRDQIGSRPGVREVTAVDLVGVREELKDRKVYVYKIAYLSSGKPHGKTAHSFEALATVERVDGVQWKVVGEITPLNSQLDFQTPAVILKTVEGKVVFPATEENLEE